MDEFYARFIRRRISFEELTYESKKLIMRASMASEITSSGTSWISFPSATAGRAISR